MTTQINGGGFPQLWTAKFNNFFSQPAISMWKVDILFLYFIRIYKPIPGVVKWVFADGWIKFNINIRFEIVSFHLLGVCFGVAFLFGLS